MTAVFFGLLSALLWGASDFSGGLASRRAGAYLAVFWAEVIGLAVLIAAIPIVREPLPPVNILLTSLGVGAMGTFALLLLYQAMVTGQMSIAAPVSALLAAALPIIIGAFTEGMPGWVKLTGFALALAAVWLISQEEGTGKPHLARLADLRWPFLAGLGFGLYFVLIHQTTQEATLWPMVASRSGGTVLLLAFFWIRRTRTPVVRSAWKFMIINGILDVCGNLFYILAGQSGRMDVAAVLSSLYPGGTVFLAWLFLKERISRWQAVGILAAFGAIVLMTL